MIFKLKVLFALQLLASANAVHRFSTANAKRSWWNKGDSKTRNGRKQKLPPRGGYTPMGRPPNQSKRFGGLFSVAPPQPTKSNRPPLPTEYEQQEGDWIDGDLWLPSRLQNEEERPQTLPAYVENLKRQVEESSFQAETDAKGVVQNKSKTKGLSRLDLALFGTYFCHAVAMTTPIVLLPLVAAEGAAGSQLSTAAFVATIASISTLGGGVGKLLNGAVCQRLGGTWSSALYLTGLAASLWVLSISPAEKAGGLLALIEFFASVQWTACSLVFANHYKDLAKFAKGITLLSLASTSGQMVAKMGGTALLRVLPSWRAVARFAAITSLAGAAIVRTMVTEHPLRKQKKFELKYNDEQQSILQSFKAVLGSPLFWQVGIAHATAMLARTLDRVLGTFFHQTTALSRSLCGGLTAFITVGFVHGLIKGKKFHKLPHIRAKSEMLSKNYAISALTAAGMAVLSNTWVRNLFPSKTFLALVAASMTGILASNISFQFYQIPAMAANTFGKNKAVALSLIDGLGLFLVAPIWAVTGKIVANAGPHGWTCAWLMLATMFFAGGKTMMNAFPEVMLKQQQR